MKRVTSILIGILLGALAAGLGVGIFFKKANDYNIVHDLMGHNIGKKFHEDPQIPHFRQTRLLTKLEEGMTFTIEPMVNLGAYNVVVSKSDKWTVRTKDGKWSAQFEHTVLVTHKGYEILTLPS
jgi:methionyl aminopeptidase